METLTELEYISANLRLRLRQNLRRALDQLHVIRGELIGLLKRYDVAKQSGNQRWVYQCKLRISVAMGMLDIYKSYAKQQAKVLAEMRRIFMARVLFLAPLLGSVHPYDDLPSAEYQHHDDELEYFIVDSLEEEEDGDDDDEDLEQMES